MPSLSRRLQAFLSSTQGRRAIDQARRAASDPRNRRRVSQLVARLRGQGRR